jgi:hypothetical protein
MKVTIPILLQAAASSVAAISMSEEIMNMKDMIANSPYPFRKTGLSLVDKKLSSAHNLDSSHLARIPARDEHHSAATGNTESGATLQQGKQAREGSVWAVHYSKHQGEELPIHIHER